MVCPRPTCRLIRRCVAVMRSVIATVLFAHKNTHNRESSEAGLLKLISLSFSVALPPLVKWPTRTAPEHARPSCVSFPLTNDRIVCRLSSSFHLMFLSRSSFQWASFISLLLSPSLNRYSIYRMVYSLGFTTGTSVPFSKLLVVKLEVQLTGSERWSTEGNKCSAENFL